MCRVAVINLSDGDFMLDEHEFVGTIDILNDDIHYAPEADKGPAEKSDELDIEGSVNLDQSILTPVEKDQLIELIKKHKQVFSKGDHDIGRTNLVEHVIQLKPGASPYHARPYAVPHHLKEVLQKQVDTLLEAGLITKSDASSFTSPVLLVKKKDGGYRMCIDLRRLNRESIKSKQRLPTSDDIANILARKKYFSSLDLASGYWQVALSENSKDLTTFILPNYETYKWEVMAFGLTSAPATFQRLMTTVLVDLIAKEKAICYVDDILLADETFEEHLETLSFCFQRLHSCGLKLKLSKAAFCRKELNYLGTQLPAKVLSRPKKMWKNWSITLLLRMSSLL